MDRLGLLFTDPVRVTRSLRQRFIAASAVRGVMEWWLRRQSPAEYWTRHNVTAHESFSDAESSLRYFDWRNAQYPGYIELMPATGQEGKRVLDYGCGPGNDLVGFSVYSKPARLIGMDVSPVSLEEARRRLALHDARVELLLIDEKSNRLPLGDASVDYVHSSGVVHHVPDPVQVLRELHRVLTPGGEARIMVYNHDSIWLHLRAAYLMRVRQPRYSGLPLTEVFKRSTDGEFCPISRAYRPAEFCAMAEHVGFRARFLGAAISMDELNDLDAWRHEAIQSRALEPEHREFLARLRIDESGLPRDGDVVAGIDACYSFVKPV